MPAIKFQCPGCQITLQTSNAALAGKKIKCPKCGAAAPVPKPEPEEVIEEVELMESVTTEEAPPPRSTEFRERDERDDLDAPRRPRRPRPRDEDDFDDAPPVRRKKKKKKRKNADIIDIAVALLTLAYIVTALFAFNGYLSDPPPVVVQARD